MFMLLSPDHNTVPGACSVLGPDPASPYPAPAPHLTSSQSSSGDGSCRFRGLKPTSAPPTGQGTCQQGANAGEADTGRIRAGRLAEALAPSSLRERPGIHDGSAGTHARGRDSDPRRQEEAETHGEFTLTCHPTTCHGTLLSCAPSTWPCWRCPGEPSRSCARCKCAVGLESHLLIFISLLSLPHFPFPTLASFALNFPAKC